MNNTPFPANPYVIGVPLAGDAGFFGRRDIFVFIEDVLNTRQQNVVVLFGQRRIGKTSLLHQISRKIKESDDVVPIYFDLQGKAQKSLGEVLYSLARTIARSIKIIDFDQSQFDDAGRFFYDKFLPLIQKQLGKKRLLLLFDEFDVLGDELSNLDAASETLFPYMQELIRHDLKIVFVFVVGRRIEELTTHYHFIFKQGVYRKIGLLKRTNARDLIVEPVKDHLILDEAAIKAILALTEGHPYFSQLICFEIFNDMKAKAQRRVRKADVLNIVDQAIVSGHGALNWFWDGLPRAERFILSSVAHVSDERGLATQANIRGILEKHKIILTGLELKDVPDRLVVWEMLRHGKETGSYRFVVELVRRWILKNHPLKSARRDIDLISKRASRLYENARDAHGEGDLEYARQEYQRALDTNPNHSGAQLGLAQVLFELGETETSIQEFERAYSIDDVSARDGLVRARLRHGKKLEIEGKENEALSQYELAYKIAPSNETTCRSLAVIWLKRGNSAISAMNITNSISSYRKATRFDNSDETKGQIQDKLMTQINQSEANGDTKKVIKLVSMLKSLLPENDSIREYEIGFWTRRGDFWSQNKKEGAKAIKAYQKALELKPGDQTLIEKRDIVSHEWEKLLEIDRLYKVASLAQNKKKWTEAIPIWMKMLNMDILDYKGDNVAANLAEAHDNLSIRYSMSVQIRPPKEVIKRQKSKWSIFVQNTGEGDLEQVTANLPDTKTILNEPLNLPASITREIIFSTNFDFVGEKSLNVTVTARSKSGFIIVKKESIAINVRSTPKIDDIPSPEEIQDAIEYFKGKIDISSVAPNINITRLFKIYTGRWLNRKFRKGNQILGKNEDRLVFMQELALYLYINKITQIHYKSLPDAIKKHFKIGKNSIIDHFKHDLSSCTFLNGNTQGYYQFTDKSFLEYFTATKLISEINLNREKLFKSYQFPDAVNLFVSEGIDDHNRYTLQNWFTKGSGSKTLLGNLINVFKIKGRIVGINMSGFDFAGMNLQGCVFEHCNFDHANFLDSIISHTMFICCSLVSVNFGSAKLKSIEFKGCTLRQSEFGKSIFDAEQPKIKQNFKNGSVSFIDSILKNVNLSNQTFENCNFSNSDFGYANLINTRFVECNFENCTFTKTRLYRTFFSGCDLKGARFFHSYMRKASFVPLKSTGNTKAKYRRSNQFDNTSVRGCNLAKTTILNQFLKDSDFYNSLLPESKIIGTTFVNCKLERLFLKGARIIGSNIFDSSAKSNNFENSVIVRSNLNVQNR
jgi:uncharacterized protein YjbI with pentapeptide repeats/tetratricopeptide (TPR) repeat protein